MVPREVCTERSEKSNRYRKITLNVQNVYYGKNRPEYSQKSAEAILAESFFFSEGPNQ